MDNTIDFTWEYNVDALKNLSLSATNASAIKYAMAYKDFKLQDVIPENKMYRMDLTKQMFAAMCAGYVEQDKKVKRDISNNVSVKDYDKMNEAFRQKPHCWKCGKTIA